MSNNRLQAKGTFSVNLELYKQKMEMFTIHISLSDHRQLATFYTNKLLSAVGSIPKDYWLNGATILIPSKMHWKII